MLTNSCFRVNARGAITVDKRGGAFADDLYLVIADNRNGTRASTNTDVSLFKSTDGGIDLDRADAGERRPVEHPGAAATAVAADGLRARRTSTPGTTSGSPGWTSAGDGWIHGTWQDRRLDTTSPVGGGEWPTSKTRQGNYIAWYWGGRCRTTRTGPITSQAGRQCVHPDAAIITQPTGPSTRRTLPRSRAVGLPVPELRDLRHAVQLGLLLPRRHLLRRLRERVHRHGQPCLGDVDGCPERAVVEHAGRQEPGVRAVGRLGRHVSGQQDAHGQQHAKSSDSAFWVTPCPTND